MLESLINNHEAIAAFEKIIIDAGGKIEQGKIIYNGHDKEVLEAIEYLIQDWDYFKE